MLNHIHIFRKTRLPQVETTNLKNTNQNCSPGGGSTVNGKNKKTADRILDLIQNEIDLQGKCIEDLSKEIRFHLEQVMDELECSQKYDIERSNNNKLFKDHRRLLASKKILHTLSPCSIFSSCYMIASPLCKICGYLQSTTAKCYPPSSRYKIVLRKMWIMSSCEIKLCFATSLEKGGEPL